VRDSDRALVDRFLDMMAAEAGASANTLAAYRSDLENALAAVPGHGPLQDKLAEVLAEQESRAQITGGPA